ncbi:hypothetical protein [Hamadaea tsunoensis]|uniref:hypothetical protein n=1 Tax=Hamadaea tsunoensis TaxID=53368 RepID=UPI00041DEF89|nr:hypothetical protein [Hamadaea tsunoensis]
MSQRRWLWAAAALFLVGTVVSAIASGSWGSPGWVVTATSGLSSAIFSLIAVLLDRGSASPPPPKPRPRRRLPYVREVTDRITFNIHAAIPLAAPADRLTAMYPKYIPRDLDDLLRKWLRHRADGSGIVVLVGPTAAGKSRTLFEALRHELPGWRLYIPADGADLDELVRHRPRLDHTVILLDELQTYFTNRPLTADTVKFLLAGRAGRVLLAGTIRPVDLEAIVGPQTGIGQQMNSDAYQVMRMLASPSGRQAGAEPAIRLDLPGRLSPAEQARAAEIARADPRIALASERASDHAVIPTLAGATELIRHWTGDGADTAGRAVITAAVLARRCGHPDVLPAEVLAALAVALLAGRGAAPLTADWFKAAIAWAEEPVRGQIAAVRQVRTQAGRIDGYYVSDILVGHSLDERDPEVAGALADETSWRQLVDVATPDACGDIGSAAYRRGLSTIAESAWVKAADRGNRLATRRLALLLYELGEHLRARRWLDRGVAARDPAAMTLAASLEEHEGRPAAAEALLLQAIDEGDVYALGQIGFFLRVHGRDDESESWYARAAEGGDANAMTNLGYAHLKREDLDGAERWNLAAARLGHAGAMQNLAVVCRERGDGDGMRTWLLRAAETGYALALADDRRIRPWPGESGDEGISNSILDYARVLLADGDRDEALKWFQRGGELGDSRCAAAAADLLDSDGLRARAAELAYENLRLNRADLLGGYGHETGVEPHLAIMRGYAERLRTSGDEAGALRWEGRATRLADPGTPDGHAREVWHPGSWRWRSEPV